MEWLLLLVGMLVGFVVTMEMVDYDADTVLGKDTVLWVLATMLG